jgi:hypothetical protein
LFRSTAATCSAPTAVYSEPEQLMNEYKSSKLGLLEHQNAAIPSHIAILCFKKRNANEKIQNYATSYFKKNDWEALSFIKNKIEWLQPNDTRTKPDISRLSDDFEWADLSLRSP